MIRRFIPIWFPVLLIALVSAVSYKFWRIQTMGVPMLELPTRFLGGHAVSLSRPVTIDPMTEQCEWRVNLPPQALAALGGLEISYSTETMPLDGPGWIRVPVGCTVKPFVATLAFPPKTPSRLWLRETTKGESVSWDLPKPN